MSIEDYHVGDSPLEWKGCYSNDKKYNKYVTSDSFAHPAKMSWGLLDRIFQHLILNGWITSGSTVIDFMAGSGRTLIMAELFGYQSVGVEIEPHFIKMINDNVDKLESITGRKSNIQLFQGDTRQLSTILSDQDYVGICSPPYSTAILQNAGGNSKVCLEDAAPLGYGRIGVSCRNVRAYSNNSENIGNLSDRPLIGITSPPYGEAQRGCGIVNHGYQGSHLKEMGKNQPGKVAQRCGYLKDIQGSSEGQIGNQNSESYLSAMLQVYSEAYCLGISPLVIVTKNSTKNGELRRLDLDTVKLLEAVGYEIFDYHRSILFEEQTQATLDGNQITTPKGRLSFFKRLSYEKGNVVARWEDIIFVRVPA